VPMQFYHDGTAPEAPTLPGDAGSVGSLAPYCKSRATSRT
jgi:hypothetical protein